MNVWGSWQDKGSRMYIKTKQVCCFHPNCGQKNKRLKKCLIWIRREHSYALFTSEGQSSRILEETIASECDRLEHTWWRDQIKDTVIMFSLSPPEMLPWQHSMTSITPLIRYLYDINLLFITVTLIAVKLCPLFMPYTEGNHKFTLSTIKHIFYLWNN